MKTLTPHAQRLYGQKESIPFVDFMSFIRHGKFDENIGHSTESDNNPIKGDISVKNAPANHQHNNVDVNSGITGIQGDGNMITINQCPKEIIDLVVTLLKTVKP